MVNCVSYNVHKGVIEDIYDRFIHFRFLTLKHKSNILFELLVHIPDNTVHFLKCCGNRHHSYGHYNVLKLVGKLFQLTGGFIEAVKVYLGFFQVGRGDNRTFGYNDLSHKVKKSVELIELDGYHGLLMLFGRLFGDCICRLSRLWG